MNKIVLILPVSVMALLFYFGYQYINSGETTTNKSLQNDIVLSWNATRDGDLVKLTGKWDWTKMPADGLIGDDYITITFQSEDGTFLVPRKVISTELTLLKGDEVLKSFEGTVNESGIFFKFPNKIIDHISYGNRGEVTLLVQLDEKASYRATLSYIHTWIDHELTAFNKLYSLETGLQEILTNKYWVVKRLIQF